MPKVFKDYGAYLVTALVTILLYFPFLGSDLVFDDNGLFKSGAIYQFAQTLFNFSPRTFPYFTLGFVSVMGGGIEANRIVSLVLHIMCAAMIYLLIKALLINAWKLHVNEIHTPRLDGHSSALAASGAIWFAIHPVAVYGASYLAQRTILFATLFSLLSIWFYCRTFTENRTGDVVSAAIFYSLAVFSKEHAIMLPFAAVALTSLYSEGFRSSFQRISLYLLLCLPAAVIVYLAAKTVVTVSYEPDVSAMIPRMYDISIMAESWGPWLVSMVIQAGLFFDYLFFWIVPDIRYLSADMRFDFVSIWFSWLAFPKVILFLLAPILAIYFLRKKGIVALFCCGFLYCWILFMTELVSVRFQEPFVLYRSYLWAPGYVMMLAAVLATIRPRWLSMLAIPIFLVLFMLARDRLTSLETEANVWKDAAKKLSSSTILGSDRIFYNRGLAYLREKKYEEAFEDFSRTIQQSPKVAPAYYNRALAAYGLKRYSSALTDLNYSVSLNEKDSSAQYMRGVIYEQNGCLRNARYAYAESMALGNPIAKLKLDSLRDELPANKELATSAFSCNS